MVSVILMMAGSSSRMNANENKLFLELGDKKVFQHSLDKFLEFGLEVICVIKEENIKYLGDYLDKVKKGLELVEKDNADKEYEIFKTKLNIFKILEKTYDYIKEQSGD